MRAFFSWKTNDSNSDTISGAKGSPHTNGEVNGNKDRATFSRSASDRESSNHYSQDILYPRNLGGQNGLKSSRLASSPSSSNGNGIEKRHTLQAISPMNGMVGDAPRAPLSPTEGATRRNSRFFSSLRGNRTSSLFGAGKGVEAPNGARNAGKLYLTNSL
jgi:hypothetical protein